jgi:hypothetical protein
VKPKQKRQKDWRKRQALVYNPLHNLPGKLLQPEMLYTHCQGR